MGVLFGGRSSEHAISCISAGSVLRSIDRSVYDVVPIGITKDGHWVLETDDPDQLTIRDGVLPEVRTNRPDVVLHGDPTHPGVVIGADAVARRLDVVFPVLHGPWGEDGTIQGLLELAGIPYVGSGVFASAASMDKGHMKALLRAAGLPVGPYVVITPSDWMTSRTRVLEDVAALGFPVFVKPARAGSSVGITKVKDAAGLESAIEEARSHDPRVVVEASLEGVREIECGVLTDPSPRASLCAEIIVGGDHEFYDFEAKYLDDAAELRVPAALTDQELAEVRRLAVLAFQALDCEGLARVDFFIQGSQVVINELNTMPGFTPISMYPRMWAASGVDYPDLIGRLLADALRRGTGLR